MWKYVVVREALFRYWPIWATRMGYSYKVVGWPYSNNSDNYVVMFKEGE